MSSNLELNSDLDPSLQAVLDESGNASPLALSATDVGVGVAPGPPAALVLGPSGTELLRGDDPGTRSPEGSPNNGLLIQSAQTVEVNIDSNDRPSDMFAVTRGSNRVEIFRVQEDGMVRIRNRGDGAVLLHFDTDRGWVFKQHGSGAGTALELTSSNPNNNNKNFIINTDGRVGIGTRSPLEKLDVVGSVRVSEDIVLVGADCAEDFDICDDTVAEPGMVMVLGAGRRLRPSDRPYDRCVAGIVSGAGDTRPGIVLGRNGSSGRKVPVALSGTANCLVDARGGVVSVGDLLTTSGTPGHAMLADDPRRAFGAVLGKAMADLEDDVGLVPVLVSLQ